MSIEPRRGGVPGHFTVPQDLEGVETVRTHGDFMARFGISKGRFQDLSSAIRLTAPEDPLIPIAEKG